MFYIQYCAVTSATTAITELSQPDAAEILTGKLKPFKLQLLIGIRMWLVVVVFFIFKTNNGNSEIVIQNIKKNNNSGDIIIKLKTFQAFCSFTINCCQSDSNHIHQPQLCCVFGAN